MDDFKFRLFIGILAAMMGFIAMRACRIVAVEIGAAHYVIVEPRTNKTEFQWINKKPNHEQPAAP